MKRYGLVWFTVVSLALAAGSCSNKTTNEETTADTSTTVAPETTVPSSGGVRPDTMPTPPVDSRVDTTMLPDQNHTPPDKKMEH